MSIDVIRASGLFCARITVWAPVPHPASSTLDSAGYRVSSWRSPVRVSAWSLNRSASRSVYPWT